MEVDESAELDPNRMQHIYSLTKHIEEILCKSFCKRDESRDYTILRFGIPYSPRSWTKTTFSNFMNSVIESKSIQIKRSSNRFRKFIYVTNLARRCAAALNNIVIEYIEKQNDNYGDTLASYE
ncbi:NAD-dependent epimerase/dehydratase family protein [Bacillus thuringiensis]|uniref:NAD-dependent epimerase/dehydratase family protein n=1 Tax=Bacillus thuringiensis TaxID=1428 RepID=UPI003D65FB15